MRISPTGECWCGCGRGTDRGSFFVPGHDKKAESKLIMDVFGGVPQFLVAFGKGPKARGNAIDATHMGEVMRLNGLTIEERKRMAIEYTDPEDRYGRLKFLKEVRSDEFDLTEGSAPFTFQNGPYHQTLRIPFVDIAGVYRDFQYWVARVHGSIVAKGDVSEYVSYGRGNVFNRLVQEEKLEQLVLGSLADLTTRAKIRCAAAFASPPGARYMPRIVVGDIAPQPKLSNILEAPMIGNVVCQGFERDLTEEEKAAVEARFPGQKVMWSSVDGR